MLELNMVVSFIWQGKGQQCTISFEPHAQRRARKDEVLRGACTSSVTQPLLIKQLTPNMSKLFNKQQSIYLLITVSMSFKTLGLRVRVQWLHSPRVQLID